MTNLNLEKIFQEQHVTQNFDELSWIAGKVEELNPTAILEVGIERGGTLKVWEQILEQNGRGKENILIGVDIGLNMGWDWEKSSIDIRLIRGNSHDFETLDKVKKILHRDELDRDNKDNKDRQLDFVYIDGEHTNDAARMDFNFFGSMIREGGIIGFHDYHDVKGFLSELNSKTGKNRLEVYEGKPPFKKFGIATTIGTAIYRK